VDDGRWAIGEEVMVKIRQGDTVVVLRGEERGAKGTVRQVIRGWKVDRQRRRIGRDPNKDRVIVSGINIVKKHQKPTGRRSTQVGIIEFEAPIHISKVTLFCGDCNRPARVGYQLYEDGTKGRVCKRCGRLFD
jgi:large subunit ribosomal protein L24